MKNSKVFEESPILMFCLTFIGGFLNSYSYFTRNGIFVTFHTGNLVRLSLGVIERDWGQFSGALRMIIAGMFGASIAFYLIHKIHLGPSFYRLVLLIEAGVFLLVSFVPADIYPNIISSLLAMVAMFQLTSFRKVTGEVHNTTIMTGNLRTLVSKLTAYIFKPDAESRRALLLYATIFFAFPIGVIVGGYISMALSYRALLICSVIITGLLVYEFSTKDRLPKV